MPGRRIESSSEPVVGDAEASSPTEGPIDAFAYVTAEKAWLYRRIMRLIGQAKARFELHVRPSDVFAALHDDRLDVHVDGVEVERALAQLCAWGNLEQHLDTALWKTVEDAYRPRYLYQMTRRGEAAERALRTFEESVEQAGELRSAALVEIRDYLAELGVLAQAQPPDPGKVARTLEALVARFDEMTERAQGRPTGGSSRRLNASVPNCRWSPSRGTH